MKQSPEISFSEQVAKDLLRLEAVKLSVAEPFTWASGIKSPVYCDNRKVNSDVAARNNVVNAFVDMIKNKFPQVEMIAGVATGGIPAGALVADRLNLPFVYVRQAPKEHGLMKQVEGGFKVGDKVVVIEDLISTGGSSMKAVWGLKNEGLEVLGLISIMTYNFKKATDLFDQENLSQYSLCDLDVVLKVASEEGRISDNDKELILQFREAPDKWAR